MLLFAFVFAGFVFAGVHYFKSFVAVDAAGINTWKPTGSVIHPFSAVSSIEYFGADVKDAQGHSGPTVTVHFDDGRWISFGSENGLSEIDSERIATFISQQSGKPLDRPGLRKR